MISINPLGNIGNRMIQYMAAASIGERIQGPVSYNCDLPEWGMSFDRHLHEAIIHAKDEKLILLDKDLMEISDIVQLLNRRQYKYIVLEGYFQRFNLFRERSLYNKIFTDTKPSPIALADNEILINIRAGDLLGGIGWYPLVPVGFYADLLDLTGYRPVFMGQLDRSPYLAEIQRRFPNARMIKSAGPLADFSRIRNAPRICIAVSTFSWLAAWFSDATEIHYPMLGFLHPTCFRFGRAGLGGINLVPFDEFRYQFHLFPYLNGMQIDDYIEFTNSIRPISRKISAKIAKAIHSEFPIARPVAGNEMFDERWYLQTYVDAAWNLGEGLYLDAKNHYLDVGKALGYRPHKPLFSPTCRNIALGKSASQSSVSDWSAGPAVTDDASRAINGDNRKSFGFHTDLEDFPWWKIDLASIFAIECINIFNRKGENKITERIMPFSIEFSLDDQCWHNIYTSSGKLDFCRESGCTVPFQWIGDFKQKTRFIRIVAMKKQTYLHLAEVEIFGRAGSVPAME